MSLIASMSITAAAADVLERRRASYALRDSDVLALCYISAFRNPDGTTVAGFVPGYQITSWPRDHLGRSSVFVLLPHGTSFYLIPRSEWDVDRPHLMDLISASHEIFSILPVGEAAGRV